MRLGPEETGRRCRLVTEIELRRDGKNPLRLRALYDSGSELNLVSKAVVEEHGIETVSTQPRPRAGFLDENCLQIHQEHALPLRCISSFGVTKDTKPLTFWSADFVGYDLILGHPWLAATDPKIRWSTGEFS